MTNNTELNGWTKVIKSVDNLLGFFVLVALILNGVILATATFTDKVSMWISSQLFGLLIVGVVVIALVRPQVFQQKKPVRVNLDFRPLEASAVHLDVDNCILKVRDEKGNVKFNGKTNLTSDLGGWTFLLPGIVDHSDSVGLTLCEKDNMRKWEADSFPPYVKTVKPYEISQGAR